ncbi:MAG: hypothetical protein LWY06_01335 [Firmicutes bacterium]|nr:hypothetical protein [Bacillota bacterium]
MKKVIGIIVVILLAAAFMMAGCAKNNPPAAPSGEQANTTTSDSDAGKSKVDVSGTDGKASVTTDGDKTKVEAEGKDGSAKIETNGDNAKVDVKGEDGSVKIDTKGGATNMEITGADGKKVTINTDGKEGGVVNINSDKGSLKQETGEEAAKGFKAPFFPGAVVGKAVKQSGELTGTDIKENKVVELTTDAPVKDVKEFYVKALSGAQVVDTGDSVVVNLPSKTNPSAGTTVAITADKDSGKTKVVISERAGK